MITAISFPHNLSWLVKPLLNICVTDDHRAHQTRQSEWNFCPISAEITLPWLQSKPKVSLLRFTSPSFLANNLHFMVKLIDKAIVINVKIHKNERKRLIHVSMKLLEVSLSCLHFSEGELKSLCFPQVWWALWPWNYATLDTVLSSSFLLHEL